MGHKRLEEKYKKLQEFKTENLWLFQNTPKIIKIKIEKGILEHLSKGTATEIVPLAGFNISGSDYTEINLKNKVLRIKTLYWKWYE